MATLSPEWGWAVEWEGRGPDPPSRPRGPQNVVQTGMGQEPARVQLQLSVQERQKVAGMAECAPG